MSEARNNRYELLTNYCKKKNIIHLFIAHHKDDNLETFLNRRIAGSDFEGLQCMQYLSTINKVCIIHPLLDFTKDEIMYYNNENKIPFINDPSNINLKFTRPVIRKYLEVSSDQVNFEIKNEFQIIKNYFKNYNFMISEILNKCVKKTNKNHIEVDFDRFKNLDDIILEKLNKKFYQYF